MNQARGGLLAFMGGHPIPNQHTIRALGPQVAWGAHGMHFRVLHLAFLGIFWVLIGYPYLGQGRGGSQVLIVCLYILWAESISCRGQYHPWVVNGRHPFLLIFAFWGFPTH